MDEYEYAEQQDRAMDEFDKLTKERDELRATVEKCLKDIGVTSKEKCRVMDENKELHAKVKVLREALQSIADCTHALSPSTRAKLALAHAATEEGK